jgi:hypothetical protein
MSRDTIVCNDQKYKLVDDDIILEDDCIQNELNKYNINLEDIYYTDSVDEITIETDKGNIILDSC